MNRTARASLIVVSVLILAYPVLAWFLGLRIQHVLEDREKQGLAQIPGYSQYITIVKRDYRRGVYSSSEDLTFRLGEKALKALGATGNVDLTIHNTIHHGPFPQARDFAPATVDTQWVVPAALHDKLVIHTRMNWTGGSTTLVNSPAFNLPLDRGATLDWRGLEAHVIAGRDIGSGTVTLTSPGLTFKSPAGTIAGYQDLKLDSTLHAVYEVLNVGDAKLTLGQLQVEEPNKPFQLLAHNLTVESHSKLNGEFMDVDGGITVEAVKVNAFDTTHINYAARFTHINAPAAAALTKALRTAQSDTPGPTTAQEAAAANLKRMFDAFQGPGVDLLVKEPVVDISHLGFAMPEGALDISLKASMPGVTKEEFQGAPATIRAAFMKHLQASSNIRIDTAMLDKLLESMGKGENVAAQLQGLQRQGYLKLDGKALTTHLTFLGGQFKVNDLPFPPRPAQ